MHHPYISNVTFNITSYFFNDYSSVGNIVLHLAHQLCPLNGIVSISPSHSTLSLLKQHLLENISLVTTKLPSKKLHLDFANIL